MPEIKPLLYPYSLSEATRLDERDLWHASYKENCDCARAIEQAIAENYKDNCLQDGTAPIISRYGFDRVDFVLAATIRENMSDGRFSSANKEWTKGFYIPKEDHRRDFCVGSHPGLTDIFLNQVRKAWDKLNLFDTSHCESEQTGEIDYTGKVLVLKHSVLKDEYKTPENQLFLAKGGFGCSPNSRGRKVFGEFLNDGEDTHFCREDFLGAIKEECLPDWAKERLSEIRSAGETEADAMTMGGM